jgi:hypothetical protein
VIEVPLLVEANALGVKLPVRNGMAVVGVQVIVGLFFASVTEVGVFHAESE